MMIDDGWFYAKRLKGFISMMNGLNFRHWIVLFRVLVIYSFNVRSTVHATTSLKNVTIDDQDPSINYLPHGLEAWNKTEPNKLDHGGSHMLTEKPYGTASFNFTGVAIYFMSPLWPYTVNTAISLDSGPSTLVDLVDYSRPRTDGGPETVESHVVWKATGLNNTQHHLLISVGVNQPYAIVDALIYSEVMDVKSSSSSSKSPSSSSSKSPSSSSYKSPISTILSSTLASSTSTASPENAPVTDSKSIPRATEIAVPVTVGLLISITLLVCFFRRRRRSPLLLRRPNQTIEGSYTSLGLPELVEDGRDQAVDIISPSSRLIQPGHEHDYNPYP